jgi:hypothetical protein
MIEDVEAGPLTNELRPLNEFRGLELVTTLWDPPGPHHDQHVVGQLGPCVEFKTSMARRCCTLHGYGFIRGAC